MRNLLSKRLISLLTIKRKTAAFPQRRPRARRGLWRGCFVVGTWRGSVLGGPTAGRALFGCALRRGWPGVPGRRRRGWRACVLPALSFVRGSASVGGHLAGGGGGGARAGGVATLLSSLGRVVGTVSSCWLFGGPGRCRGGEAVRWFSPWWPCQALLLCLCLGRVGTNRS